MGRVGAPGPWCQLQEWVGVQGMNVCIFPRISVYVFSLANFMQGSLGPGHVLGWSMLVCSGGTCECGVHERWVCECCGFASEHWACTSWWAGDTKQIRGPVIRAGVLGRQRVHCRYWNDPWACVCLWTWRVLECVRGSVCTCTSDLLPL